MMRRHLGRNGAGHIIRRHASLCRAVRTIMDAADRVAQGDYSVGVQEYGPTPMRAFAHSFNAMTEPCQSHLPLKCPAMND
jgi:nitrogen fixation/metabolism regulation signal transduction histidine kinase